MSVGGEDAAPAGSDDHVGKERLNRERGEVELLASKQGLRMRIDSSLWQEGLTRRPTTQFQVNSSLENPKLPLMKQAREDAKETAREPKHLPQHQHKYESLPRKKTENRGETTLGARRSQGFDANFQEVHLVGQQLERPLLQLAKAKVHQDSSAVHHRALKPLH